MPYLIYRANEYNLRKQIMNALDDLEIRAYNGIVKDLIETGESVTVPANHQLIVHRNIGIQGDLDLVGRLVIL